MHLVLPNLVLEKNANKRSFPHGIFESEKPSEKFKSTVHFTKLNRALEPIIPGVFIQRVQRICIFASGVI